MLIHTMELTQQMVIKIAYNEIIQMHTLFPPPPRKHEGPVGSDHLHDERKHEEGSPSVREHLFWVAARPAFAERGRVGTTGEEGRPPNVGVGLES